MKIWRILDLSVYLLSLLLYTFTLLRLQCIPIVVSDGLEFFFHLGSFMYFFITHQIGTALLLMGKLRISVFRLGVYVVRFE